MEVLLHLPALTVETREELLRHHGYIQHIINIIKPVEITIKHIPKPLVLSGKECLATLTKDSSPRLVE